MRLARLGNLVVWIVLATSCDKAATNDDVRATAQQVVAALATHDMAGVASVVDSARGLRFSPYAFVDTTSDHVVDVRDVATLWGKADSLKWGVYDGSGEPIILPYSSYHTKFVYDVDFMRAPRIVVDSAPIGRGNTTNNIAAVYRGASVVEYHLPTDSTNDPMTWRSLWLVFTKTRTRWSLIGVVHGAWTS
ncbi:MAG TPA: hypothetical protein VGM82_00605 [Gemmatimonadaceae bacterium]|jgi:hypothetical protein